MTATYTFRMILKTFHGTPRNADLHAHAHESPWIMTLPLVALAVGAIGGGAALGIPPEHGFIHEYLKPVAAIVHLEGAGTAPTLQLALISTVVALGGLSIAISAYGFGVRIPVFARSIFPGAQTLFRQKWYMDHIGDGLIVAMTKAVAMLSWGFDVALVDGIVNGVGKLSRILSAQTRKLQTGQLQHYALSMVIGLVLMIGGLVLFR